MGRDDTVVTLTERAASQIHHLVATTHGRAAILRVAAVRTHCMGGRGFTYRLGLEDTTSEDDEVFEDRGLRVSIDRISAGYLEGADVDYVEPGSRSTTRTRSRAVPAAITTSWSRRAETQREAQAGGRGYREASSATAGGGEDR